MLEVRWIFFLVCLYRFQYNLEESVSFSYLLTWFFIYNPLKRLIYLLTYPMCGPLFKLVSYVSRSIAIYTFFRKCVPREVHKWGINIDNNIHIFLYLVVWFICLLFSWSVVIWIMKKVPKLQTKLECFFFFCIYFPLSILII